MQLSVNAATKQDTAGFDLEAFLHHQRGGITVEEGLALARYAADINFGDIVEIGSFRGKSAVALAHGLFENHAASGKLVCIEPHADFTGVYGGVFGGDDRSAYYRAMLDSGYADRVALVNLKSADAARAWEGPVGMLFIDGDHTYEGVALDVDCWERHLVEGGLLVFDDSLDSDIGPAHVIQELLDGQRFEKLGQTGKITVLRKLASAVQPTETATAGRMRILVACHAMIRSGGLLRFERTGRELRQWGHELCFATYADDDTAVWQSEFPVLPLDAALQQQWDVTMVPGAGFPDETIERFSLLQQPNFGYRVQHVLNDPSLRTRFLAVNRTLQPDLVVFNNTHWEPGSYTDFQARKFARLEGAVDTTHLVPTPYRQPPVAGEPLVIGGLAGKQPAVLVDTLRLLPENVTLRLFGNWCDDTPPPADLLETGRLELCGPLEEFELPAFYRAVDLVVHTEQYAGWANLVAEAMACGVPVICTTHGTTAFAQDGETALVLEEITPAAIAKHVNSLQDDTDMLRRLVVNARKRIEAFDWNRYAARLAATCQDDGRNHYTWAPELGLHGKWPLVDRYKDLEQVFEACNDATVIDFGCAEGVIARRCLEHGARTVHGLELDESRVNTAAELCHDWQQSCFFFHANLDDWGDIRDRARQVLLPQYDIVLYLGIQHHLAGPARIATLQDAIDMAGRLFAIRTTDVIYRDDDIDRRLQDAGFSEQKFDQQSQRDGFGMARIYLRN